MFYLRGAVDASDLASHIRLMRKLKTQLAASLLLIVAGSETASAQPAEVARVARSTHVAAYEGVVAWSAWSASQRRYRLMVRLNGRTEPAPVASRTVDFDPDVGRDADGRTVVVYSRCRREITNQHISAGLGCDVFSYDVKAKRESKVRGVSTAGASETHPSISGRTVAFVRVFERRPGLAGVAQHLFVKRGRKLVEIDRVRRSLYGLSERYRGGKNPAPPTGPQEDVEGVSSLELDGRRLTYEWNRTTNYCPDAPDDDAADGLVTTTDLRQVDLRTPTRRRVVETACSGAKRTVFLLGSSADRGRLASVVGIAEVGQFLDVFADGARLIHHMVSEFGPIDTALDGESLYVSAATADSGWVIVRFTLSDLTPAARSSPARAAD